MCKLISKKCENYVPKTEYCLEFSMIDEPFPCNSKLVKCGSVGTGRCIILLKLRIKKFLGCFKRFIDKK